MKANKKKNQIQKLVSIRKIVERLNPVIVKNILFMHARSGCDTTSTIFNNCETELMKLVDKGDYKEFDIRKGEEVRHDIKEDFNDRNILKTLKALDQLV